VEITFGAKTDVGRVRKRNEDNFLIDRKLQLYVVCDGMGGHAAGAVASATAVNVVRECINGNRELIDTFAQTQRLVDRRDILKLIEQTIQRACYRIFARGQENASERGMGTTLTMVMMAGGRAFIGHVGDSRVYLVREGHIHQLTEDHSLLADMVKHGRIRSTSEVDPRFRNAVTRAVGVHQTVEVDTLDLPVLPDDRFLLCSDGLTGYADAAALKNMMTVADDDEVVCGSMIDHANVMGGSDNITAVVVTVRATPESEPEKVEHMLRTLRSLTLFKYLSYSELVQIMNISEEQYCRPGDVIFTQGDVGHFAYVILQGRVQIRSSDVVIANLESGRHFGEMGLVDDQPRSADALAMDEAWLLVIPRSAFYDIMRKNSQLAVKLLWSFVKALTIRLRLTTGELSLVKKLFYAVSPEEVDRLPNEWLPPDELVHQTHPPRSDSGEISTSDAEREELRTARPTPDIEAPKRTVSIPPPVPGAVGVADAPPPALPQDTTEEWGTFDDSEEDPE